MADSMMGLAPHVGNRTGLQFGEILRLIRFRTRAIILIAVLLLVRSMLALAIPWPLKLIVDNVINQRPVWPWLAPYVPDPLTHRMELLSTFGITLLLLGAVENMLSYHGERLLLITGQQAVFRLRSRLFSHVQRLSLSFHRRRKVGELMARLGGDIQRLQDFVVSSGTGIFLHFPTAIGIIAILFIVDWLYAIVIVLTVFPLLWVARNYNQRIKVFLRRARQKEGEVWGMAQETLSAIQIVQAYGREATEEERFRVRVDESLSLSLEASSLQLQLPRMVGFVLTAAASLTIWVGAVEVLNGAISTGELLVCLAYLRGLATPIRQIAKLTSSMGKAEVAAERIAELLAETTDVVEDADPILPRSCQGDLEFRSVHFSYQSGHDALTDISFRAGIGQTIALVGSSGAGKSTIASLILRFHDPERGAVLLDGVDVRHLSLAFLRSHIALVTQEPILLSGPIWENIAYGRPDASRSDAIAAAKEAGVQDMIEKLPDGFDTMIGERGATLSGGQRQIISFARAMLRDAPIVVLDEPTSGLDAASERRLGEALERLSAGRTTIIIAHHLHTVAKAHRILVLENGRIVEAGMHEDLVRRHGHYANLWNDGRQASRAVHAAKS